MQFGGRQSFLDCLSETPPEGNWQTACVPTWPSAVTCVPDATCLCGLWVPGVTGSTLCPGRSSGRQAHDRFSRLHNVSAAIVAATFPEISQPSASHSLALLGVGVPRESWPGSFPQGSTSRQEIQARPARAYFPTRQPGVSSGPGPSARRDGRLEDLTANFRLPGDPAPQVRTSACVTEVVCRQSAGRTSSRVLRLSRRPGDCGLARQVHGCRKNRDSA